MSVLHDKDVLKVIDRVHRSCLSTEVAPHSCRHDTKCCAWLRLALGWLNWHHDVWDKYARGGKDVLWWRVFLANQFVKAAKDLKLWRNPSVKVAAYALLASTVRSMIDPSDLNRAVWSPAPLRTESFAGFVPNPGSPGEVNQVSGITVKDLFCRRKKGPSGAAVVFPDVPADE